MNPLTDRKLRNETPISDSNKLDIRNEIQKSHRSRPVSWSAWVFEHLDLPGRAHILEVGCGSGSLWQENRSRIPAGWRLILSDQSRSMIKVARDHLAGQPSAGGFLRMNGQHIPFPAESFDAVLAIGVLDLIPDTDQAFSEAWRVLRPSGQLVASAGGREHLLEMRQMLRPYLPGNRSELLGGEARRFGLENGKERLATHFEEVVCHEYLDQMQFSDLRPVLDYVLSEDELVWDMRLDHLSRFVHDVKQQISEQGQLKVQVRKGVFIARKKIV